MPALLHLPQQWCQTLKQHKDSIPTPQKKKFEKNITGWQDHGYYLWIFYLVSSIGTTISTRWSWELNAFQASSLQTAGWTGYKEKPLTAQCVMSGTQCSHRFLTTNTSISFPHSLLFHSACADGRHSRLEALHSTPLKHTVSSVKKEIHMTGFISIVCLSHLQSNVF